MTRRTRNVPNEPTPAPDAGWWAEVSRLVDLGALEDPEND